MPNARLDDQRPSCSEPGTDISGDTIITQSLMGGCVSADEQVASIGDQDQGRVLQIITATNIRFTKPSFLGKNKGKTDISFAYNR